MTRDDLLRNVAQTDRDAKDLSLVQDLHEYLRHPQCELSEVVEALLASQKQVDNRAQPSFHQAEVIKSRVAFNTNLR